MVTSESMAIETAADGVLTYRSRWQEAEAVLESWVLSLHAARGLVKLEHLRDKRRTVWQGFVSQSTWASLVDALNRSPFPEQSTPVGVTESAALTGALTWEQGGNVTTAQIAERDSAYRDVNEMLLTIIVKIAPGILKSRNVRPHPDVHIEYSYELKTPARQRNVIPELPADELAETENAHQAAEDIGMRGGTQRRCLKCGGELVVRDLTSAYEVVCVTEGRVIAAGRGI
jgi:hypothetical protein